MDKFLLVYYGGKMSATPEEGQKSMEVWMKWFKDLGKAVVDMGAPTMPGKVVGKRSTKAGFVGEQPVTGYTVLQATNLDEAVKLAKTCPQIEDGGQIAVYTIMSMQM